MAAFLEGPSFELVLGLSGQGWDPLDQAEAQAYPSFPVALPDLPSIYWQPADLSKIRGTG